MPTFDDIRLPATITVTIVFGLNGVENFITRGSVMPVINAKGALFQLIAFCDRRCELRNVGGAN